MADPVIAGDFPTVRATDAQIRFDGGLFVLSLSERRDSRDEVMHEVGRYALSPIALAFFERQIYKARAAYERFMAVGFPDPSDVQARYRAAFHAEGIARELEQRSASPPADPWQNFNPTGSDESPATDQSPGNGDSDAP